MAKLLAVALVFGGLSGQTGAVPLTQGPGDTASYDVPVSSSRMSATVTLYGGFAATFMAGTSRETPTTFNESLAGNAVGDHTGVHEAKLFDLSPTTTSPLSAADFELDAPPAAVSNHFEGVSDQSLTLTAGPRADTFTFSSFQVSPATKPAIVPPAVEIRLQSPEFSDPGAGIPVPAAAPLLLAELALLTRLHHRAT